MLIWKPIERLKNEYMPWDSKKSVKPQNEIQNFI